MPLTLTRQIRFNVSISEMGSQCSGKTSVKTEAGLQEILLNLGVHFLASWPDLCRHPSAPTIRRGAGTAWLAPELFFLIPHQPFIGSISIITLFFFNQNSILTASFAGHVSEGKLLTPHPH